MTQEEAKNILEKIFNATIASQIQPVMASETPQNSLTLDGSEPSGQPIEEMKLYDDGCEAPFSDEILGEISEILNIELERLKKYTIQWGFGGKIMVKTPDYTWKTMCGREWEVDLENKTAQWIRIS